MPAFPRDLPKLCVALGLPTVAQLAKAAEQEYKDGGVFLEFRLDYLNDPSAALALVQSLTQRYSNLRILATCRARENGGHFAGSIDQQIALLAAAAEHGAVAVDLEIESAERAPVATNALRSAVPLVLSFHNFESTPALPLVARRLLRVPADAYKLIVTARKPTDNLRLLKFVQASFTKSPIVIFAMSEMGAPTRILATANGSTYTYAAPLSSAGTAPGQISGRDMRSLYRCDRLSRQTKIYGVVADPVAHSKSPAIHNRGFQAKRLDCVYLPFLVPARWLSEWMKFADGAPVCGFSVTIPHKQKIIRYLDIVEPLAKRVGAVNTVWRKAGKWRGTNTDIDGILTPLRRHIRLPNCSVLIAGYGGAARAAAIALKDAGANITLTGRNIESARKLARTCHAEAVPLDEVSQFHYNVLLHATPVGMAPDVKGTLFPRRIPADLVFDMVYNPRETALMKRAKAQGCKLIYGSEMLLEQALRQFEIWTGETAPRAPMAKALEDSLLLQH